MTWYRKHSWVDMGIHDFGRARLFECKFCQEKLWSSPRDKEPTQEALDAECKRDQDEEA